MMDWSAPLDEEYWATPLEEEPKKNKKESLKEKILRYGIKGPVAGVAQFGHQLINVPSNLASMLGDKESAETLSFRPGYNYREALGLPEEQNIADMLIGLTPEMMAGMALPGANLGKAGQLISKIPGAGKYLQAMLSQSLPQAGLAGAMSSPENAGESALMAGATQAPFSALSQLAMSPKPQYQKVASTLGGLAGGALGGYGLSELGAPGYVSAPAGIALGALGAKGLGTKGMMMQELAGGKNNALAKERLDAAKRIGLEFLTPEEAYNSPYLARKQGQLGRTEEGSELLYDKFQKRIESESNAISKVLKQIHDPEIMGPEATRLYKEAYRTKVNPEFTKKFENNRLINSAKKRVRENEAYQHALEGVPENSLEYLDHVKLALDDMIEAAPDKEARIIRNVKKEFVEGLDKLSPEYKQARALEERKFARQGLEEAFDKTNINSGHAFYKALKSKEDFEKLMHNLRNVPEAQDKLKDMRELFKDFRKESTINKVRGLEQVGMKQNRNSVDKLMHIFENMFTGGKFDKEAVDFITSKDWDKQLAEINKITDKQKRMAKIIEVFGKGVAQSSAKKEPYLTTSSGYEVYD